MKVELMGNNKDVLKCMLNLKEQIYADPCVTLWKSEGIEQKTNFNGGLFKGIGRALSGEAICLNTYISEKENTEIVFSPDEHMKILDFELKENESLICKKGSFFCATNNIKTSTINTKQFGNNLFMQKIEGPGKVFLSVSCNIIEKELKEEEILQIDVNNLVAISQEIKLIKKKKKNGLKNALFGGMGFNNMVVKGPGKIWIEQYILY